MDKFPELDLVIVVSVAWPNSRLGTTTVPDPFGVKDILPLVSVELIVFPSTFILSTCIAEFDTFKANVVPASPSFTDNKVSPFPPPSLSTISSWS